MIYQAENLKRLSHILLDRYICSSWILLSSTFYNPSELSAQFPAALTMQWIILPLLLTCSLDWMLVSHTWACLWSTVLVCHWVGICWGLSLCWIRSLTSAFLWVWGLSIVTHNVMIKQTFLFKFCHETSRAVNWAKFSFQTYVFL